MDALLHGLISSERVASLEKDGLVRRTMMEGQGRGVVEVFRALLIDRGGKL